jgi:hypothetical protein
MNPKEINFAYKVRHALDETLENLPASSLDRLASARNIALSRKKEEPVARRVPVSRQRYAGLIGKYFGEPLSWMVRIGIATPLLLGLVLFVSIYQYEQQQRLDEIAEMDAAVLADELPLSAYLDHGFNAYLAKRDE